MYRSTLSSAMADAAVQHKIRTALPTETEQRSHTRMLVIAVQMRRQAASQALFPVNQSKH